LAGRESPLTLAAEQALAAGPDRTASVTQRVGTVRPTGPKVAAADNTAAQAVATNLRTWFLILAFVSIGLEFRPVQHPVRRLHPLTDSPAFPSGTPDHGAPGGHVRVPFRESDLPTFDPATAPEPQTAPRAPGTRHDLDLTALDCVSVLV
jgi:hypothetical protein